jgi:uncharacterized membrane protein
MKRPTDNDAHREQLIAALLMYGTWLASAIIAIGMVVGAIQPFGDLPGFGFSGYGIVKAGVALFILLPIARVALMLTMFLRERDYVYTAISAFVLAIIAAGIAMGFAQ